MALNLASLLCTCIINVVSKRDVHGSRNMFVSESCCRALGRAGTGCWCDACKHLKRGLQKSRLFLSSELWTLEHRIFWFLTGRCPISEQHLHLKHSHHFVLCFYIASYCATSAQTPKPPATLQPTKMPPDLCNFLVFLLLCTSAAWCARLNKDSQLSHPKIHILAENQRSLGCSQKHCPPHVQNHSHHPCCPWWIPTLVTQPNPVFPS